MITITPNVSATRIPGISPVVASGVTSRGPKPVPPVLKTSAPWWSPRNGGTAYTPEV